MIDNMTNARTQASSTRDRVLLVESDPVIGDLIGRQALQAVGYQVQVVSEAGAALAQALQWFPDVILIDLNLTGLSGKDLMVGLASQGVQTPIIILAQRGMEAALIQTFRLGASDYLLLPAREAEVVNAVQRVLQQVHERRDREKMDQQLQQANNDLQARVRELTTIFAFGKAMTSITDQSVLLQKILDGSMRITQADLGWFLLRDDIDRPFLVAAHRNTPASVAIRVNASWDDGISSLVAMSGEPLRIHGEPLKRFKISALGLSALIVPVKVQNKVIGLLIMLRREPAPFSLSDQHLLDALVDYASISLVNARLFKAVEGRAQSLQRMAESAQISEKVHDELIRLVQKELSVPLNKAKASLEGISRDAQVRLRPEQIQQLGAAQDAVNLAQMMVESLPDPRPRGKASSRREANLAEIARATVRRLLPFAQRGGVRIAAEIPTEPLLVAADAGMMAHVLESAVSNAIKYSSAGGQVTVHLEKTSDSQAHVFVRNPGCVLDAGALDSFFQQKPLVPAAAENGAVRPGGMGIRLSLAKEIIARENGKMWFENQAEGGVTLHIRLPMLR